MKQPKKIAKQRLQDLEESLPELERQLENHVSAAFGVATKIDRLKTRSTSRDGSQIAADPKGQYGKAPR